jgi:hypothetical protein
MILSGVALILAEATGFPLGNLVPCDYAMSRRYPRWLIFLSRENTV